LTNLERERTALRRRVRKLGWLKNSNAVTIVILGLAKPLTFRLAFVRSITMISSIKRL